MRKWQGCHGLPDAQASTHLEEAGQVLSTVITLTTAVNVHEAASYNCVCTQCACPDDAAKLFFVLLRLIAGNNYAQDYWEFKRFFCVLFVVVLFFCLFVF